MTVEISWVHPVLALFEEAQALVKDLPVSGTPFPTPKQSLSSLLAQIDLGGFVMQRREISPEELDEMISTFREGEFLSSGGKAVALYIDNRAGWPTYDVEHLPKVHLINCGMVVGEKRDRYVVVTNPNGEFEVTFRGGQRLRRVLRICGFCRRSIFAKRRGWTSRVTLYKPDGQIDWKAWNKFIVEEAQCSTDRVVPR